MEYWVDAYNLILRQNWLKNHSLAQARQKLESVVLAVNNPVRLYYDARGGTSDNSISKGRSTRVSVRFVTDQTADDAMIADLKTKKKGKVTIVTDDRELRNRAKKLRANTVRVDSFLDHLKKVGKPSASGPAPTRTKGIDEDGRPTRISKSEVDEWMREFGFLDEDPNP